MGDFMLSWRRMHVLEKKGIRLLRCPGRVLLAYVEGKGVVVVAKRDIRRGEKVLPLRGTVVRSPSKWGVQIGRDAHVDSDVFRAGRLHIAFVLRQHEARRGSDVVGGDAAHPGAPRSD